MSFIAYVLQLSGTLDDGPRTPPVVRFIGTQGGSLGQLTTAASAGFRDLMFFMNSGSMDASYRLVRSFRDGSSSCPASLGELRVTSSSYNNPYVSDKNNTMALHTCCKEHIVG